MKDRARLHLLMSPEAAGDCLAQLQSRDTVLLLDRAVELVLREPELASLQQACGTVGIGGKDCEARGLSPAGLKQFDDAGIVACVVAHQQVLSWV